MLQLSKALYSVPDTTRCLGLLAECLPSHWAGFIVLPLVKPGSLQPGQLQCHFLLGKCSWFNKTSNLGPKLCDCLMVTCSFHGILETAFTQELFTLKLKERINIRYKWRKEDSAISNVVLFWYIVLVCFGVGLLFLNYFGGLFFVVVLLCFLVKAANIPVNEKRSENITLFGNRGFRLILASWVASHFLSFVLF